MQKFANLRNQQKEIQDISGLPDRRNDSLFDFWSLTHLGWGILLGWLLDPFVALLILVLWEPLEILVLSPILKKYFGIVFGFESLRNSLSDIVFDTIGIVIGAWIIGSIF